MTDSTGSSTGQSILDAVGGYDSRTTGNVTGESVLDAKTTIIELSLSALEVQNLSIVNPDLIVSQLAVQSMGTQTAEFIDSSQFMVLSSTQIQAEFIQDSQSPVLTVGNGMTDLLSSSLAVLTLVRSNPDRRKLRAWSFTQDGHAFYVLHLGDLSTIVFDTTTRKWSEWQTYNLNVWRANNGVNWRESVLAVSVDDNKLFDVSGIYDTDNGEPIISILSGGYPMRLRGSLTCDEVMVTSSVGMRGLIGPQTMKLRTSDDYGLTWNYWSALDLSTATPRTQVSWQSLGEITAPGRIFEITDSGAAKRINSLELFSRNLKDG